MNKPKNNWHRVLSLTVAVAITFSGMPIAVASDALPPDVDKTDSSAEVVTAGQSALNDAEGGSAGGGEVSPGDSGGEQGAAPGGGSDELGDALGGDSDELGEALGGDGDELGDTSGGDGNELGDASGGDAAKADGTQPMPGEKLLGGAVNYSVVAFAPLANKVASQTASVSAVLADLILPESLDATVSDGETEAEERIGGITWQSEPEFAAIKIGALEIIPAGTYIFTPTLPQGYALAGGVAAPVIEVEVAAQGIVKMAGYSGTISGDMSFGSDDTISGAITFDGQTNGPITVTVPTGTTVMVRGVVTVSGTVTITGGGTLKRDVTGDLFTVGSGAELIFGDIIVDGNKGSVANASGSLVRLNGGNFIMNYGAVLQNNTADDSVHGGGVGVYGGVFTMNGGEISDNRGVYGGAVALADDNSTFNMEDGELSGNEAVYGGGVYIRKSNVFTMKNGEISGNSANGAAYYSGGGVHIIEQGTFNMEDGTISGNSANKGGGVHIDEQSSGTFNMENGTISGNSADNGGGVHIDGSGTFNMENGTISGNSADNGGGVCIAGDATFNMSGGAIVGNTAINGGGGIILMDFFDMGNATFTVGGTAAVKNNQKGAIDGSMDNVFLGENNYITLGTGQNGVDAPMGGMEVWVTKTSNGGVFVQSGADDLISSLFHSDNYAFMVAHDSDTLKLAAAIYDISLYPDTNKDFGSVAYGYASQIEHNIDVQNIGNVPVGALTVELSGANSDSFTLSSASISGIAVSGAVEFTVKPNTGLPVGIYGATVTVSGENGLSKSIDMSFEVTKATPTGTWPSGLTATYGQALSEVSLASYTDLGGVAGTFAWDTPADEVGGAGTNSHSMTFWPTDTANYNSSTNSSVGVSVSPKFLTITGATIASKTYDGDTAISDAAITLVLDGVIPGDSVTYDISNASYTDSADAGDDKPTTFTVVLTGAFATNYSLANPTYTSATTDVTKKNIDIASVVPLTKTYDAGDAATAGAVTFDAALANSKLAAGIDYTVVAEFTGGDYNAGGSKPYIYTVTMENTTAANNYDLTGRNTKSGADGVISKASGLTATTPSAINILESDTALSTFDLDSIALDKDDCGARSYALKGSLGGATAVLGSGAVSLGGTNNATLTYQGDGESSGSATQTITITTANYADIDVTITFTAIAKTPTTVTATAPSTGLMYGETLGNPSATAQAGGLNFIYSYSGILADAGGTVYGPSSTEPSEPGTYTVTAMLDSLTHAGSGTADFTISPKPLTWNTGGTAANKTYNGTKTTAQATAPTLDGVIYGDTVSVIAGTLSFADANAGIGKAVTASGYGIGGTDAWKYIVPGTQPSFGTANIDAKNITITPNAGQNKDYGSADPALTYTSSEALVSGDSFSGALARVAGDNAGDYAITLGTLTAGSNYSLGLSATSVNFTINKATYTGGTTATAAVRAGKATVGATLILPDLPEGANYAAGDNIGVPGGTVALITSHNMLGRRLTFSTTGQTAETSATITIAVTGAVNYNDYNMVVTITARDPDDAEKVADEIDALTFEDIKSSNTLPNNITSDLGLITTGKAHSLAISWQSSDAAVIAANGRVAKPSNAAGDKAVTLTATITSGAKTGTKVFRLTVKALPPPTGEVGGAVTDNQGRALSGLTVKIMTGGTNGTLIGTTATDEKGSYGFANLPYGVYSLVVYDGANTVTRLIKIVSDVIVAPNIEMQDGNQNTYVEVSNADTPSVAVENLEAMFAQEDKAAAQEAGASVVIKLVVEQVQSPVNPDDADKVSEKLESGKELGLYLSANLLKTITGSASSDVTDERIQPPDDTALRLVIDLPQEIWNLEPYSIIRVHNGVAATIPAAYDSDLQTLTFDADKFSTYAIAYTPSIQSPANPSSGGGRSSYSGGNGGAATPAVASTYWIEVAQVKAMAKSAKEQGAQFARSRRFATTGVRKAALMSLAESGLRYQHDTVLNGAVQVRIYADNPGAVTGDLLVSGYVKGDAVESTSAIFRKWFSNKIAVVGFDQQGGFGMQVGVAAKVDLSGMNTSNLFFYSYDRRSNTYSRVSTGYRIDANGYLHFATTLAGHIVISDDPLSRV